MTRRHPTSKRVRRAAVAARRHEWTRDAGVALFAATLAVNAAAASTAPLTRADLQRLQLAAWAALDAIRGGQGTEAHLAALVDAANLTTVLTDAGLGAEWGEVADTGADAVRALAERWQPGGAHPGRLIFRGPEINAVSRLLELHDAQLRDERMTQGAITQAVSAIHHRIAAADAATAQPGVTTS